MGFQSEVFTGVFTADSNVGVAISLSEIVLSCQLEPGVTSDTALLTPLSCVVSKKKS